MDNTSSGSLTIEETAGRLGTLRWVELEVHRILGSNVQRITDTATKLAVAEWSEHHGWHAELLEQRMPTVRELSPERQTAPTREAQTLVEGFGRIDASDPIGTRGLIAVYARVVLPQLIAAYVTVRCGSNPVADAPAIRSIGFISGDLTADLAAASARISGLSGTAAEIDAVGVLVTGLEIAQLETGRLNHF